MKRKIEPTRDDWNLLMANDPISKLNPLACVELVNIVLSRMLDEAEAKLVQNNGNKPDTVLESVKTD